MRAFDFNGLSLNVLPFSVSATNAFSKPDIDITEADLMRKDGVLQLYRKITSRTISVAGKIKGTSEEEVDNALDMLTRKVYRGRGKGGIGVGYAGGMRYFYGTANMTVDRAATDVSRMTYGISLKLEKPYALDDAGLIAFGAETTVTTQYATIGVVNGGTYLAAPQITMLFNTVPNGNSPITFSLTNPETSESLTIQTTVKNGDTINIDCEKSKVFLGTDEVFATGNFPEWLPEGGLLEYADDLATRSVVITPLYMRKWL